MKEKIEEILHNYFKTNNFKVLNRLMGGMSNYTYLVSADDTKYTVRYPGEYCEEFVDRKLEEEGIQLFDSLNLTNKTIFFDVKNHIKISKYIEGRSLNELKMNNERLPFKKVKDLLKVVHQSDLRCSQDYDPFARLEKYEKSLNNLGYQLPNEYLELREYFYSFKNYLESIEKVLCHNDSQPSNFILTDNDLKIVDFEFVGNNDFIYDIACFANMDIVDGEELLNVYFDYNVLNDYKKRFYLWRAFQCFQWFNVAMFKELVGMSKTLKLDFKMIAFTYLKYIKQNLDVVRTLDI